MPVPKGVSPEKFDSCVDQVKDKEGEKVNAYAVCNSSLGKDEKRTDNPLTDRVAYKQCVAQMKAQHASNPWTQCNARFGIDKSDKCECDKCSVEKGLSPGMSFRDLQKKEAKWQQKAALRPEKVKEVTPAVHMKKPKQTPKVIKADTSMKEWKINSTPQPQDLVDAVSRDPKMDAFDDQQQAQAAAIFKFQIQPGISYRQLHKMEKAKK